MGNGASIFLSADLSKNLSEKSIKTFQDFENECIARNLNAEQIYDLLVSKYEELLDFDSLKKAEEKPVNVPEQNYGSKPSTQESKRFKGKASWGASILAKKKQQEKREINAYYSKLSQRSKATPKLTNEDSNRSLVVDTGELKTIREEIFSLTREGSCVSCGDKTERIADNKEVTFSSETSCSELTACMEEFECKLCRKQFPSRPKLEQHLRYSEVHRQTLLSLKEKFFDDANGLDCLGKKAIKHFQDSFQASHSYAEGELNLSKLRWKKAIGRVVSRFMARKYETFVSQLRQSHLHFPLVDDQIQLLHTDSKFFWRSKSRFIIYFYYHELFDCIEIIPQLLPNFQLLAAEGNASGIVSTTASSTCSQESTESNKVSPRFYINRRVIRKILLQQMDPFESEERAIAPDSDDDEVWTTTTASLLSEVASESLRQPTPHYPSNKKTPTSSSTSSKSQLQPLSNTTNPELITIPPPALNDIEICKFLLSKLKMDNQLIDTKMAVEKSIYFDTNHMMKNHQLVTINTVMPYGLKPMNIEGLKLYDTWEIKSKLQEIEVTHRELNQAVNKAEEMSKTVQKIFSPTALFQRFSPYFSPNKRFFNKFSGNATATTTPSPAQVQRMTVNPAVI